MDQGVVTPICATTPLINYKYMNLLHNYKYFYNSQILTIDYRQVMTHSSGTGCDIHPLKKVAFEYEQRQY